MRLRPLVEVGFILVLSYLAGADGLARWAGAAGEDLIRNPKTPVHPDGWATCSEDLRIRDDSSARFSTIAAVGVDREGDIYIVDRPNHQVVVFDRDGRFQRTFGQHGQGPGEFQNPEKIFIGRNDEIVVCDSVRISIFDRMGEYLRGSPTSILSSIDTLEITPEGVAYGTWILIGKTPPLFREFVRLNSSFRAEKVFESLEIPPERGFDPFRPRTLRLAMSARRELVVGSPDAYEFRCYAEDGRLLRRMVKDYEPLPVSQKERDALVQGAPEGFRKQYAPSSTHPAWTTFLIDSADRLFVQTPEKRARGAETGFVYDIFDPDYRYVARLEIPGSRLIALADGKAYTLGTSEEGIVFLRRFAIKFGSADE